MRKKQGFTEFQNKWELFICQAFNQTSKNWVSKNSSGTPAAAALKIQFEDLFIYLFICLSSYLFIYLFWKAGHDYKNPTPEIQGW